MSQKSESPTPAQLPEMYYSPDETVQRALDAAGPNVNYVVPRGPNPESFSGAVETIKPDPLAWAAANAIIKYQGYGFPEAQTDGSVIIWNKAPAHKTSRKK